VANHTPNEMMTVAASRLLSSSDVCFVGIGAPSAACNLAKSTHAPGLVLIYESGTLDTRPEVLPLSIGDGELCDTALTTVSVPEMFQYWLQGRRISKGFLGGAQVDRYANINTTVIGDYEQPRVRLPGGGGAPEIAAHCDEVLIMVPHSSRVLVDKVDFVTSLGHGTGPASRREAGLVTAGPSTVITDLCIFEPHPETSQLQVVSIHEGVTEEQVRDATGWPVEIVADAPRTQAPSADELAILRELKARTAAAHAG
jgi:glutaconate CoA-transferase, subunit B